MQNNEIKQLKKGQKNRFYPMDDEALLILQKNNVYDFLNWSNLLLRFEEREQICGYLSRYISDIKKCDKI